jgi:asparagine synthase (glutamine-hydrolysing)
LVAFERRVILPGLLTIEDRTHSAFGMEGRVPLLDPLLAQAASRIPMATKSPPESQRRLFREVMGQALPRAAASRVDKMGFPVPLEAWFQGREVRHLLDRIRPEDLDRLHINRSILLALERGLLPMRMAYFLTSLSLFLQSAPISLPTEAQAS